MTEDDKQGKGGFNQGSVTVAGNLEQQVGDRDTAGRDVIKPGGDYVGGDQYKAGGDLILGKYDPEKGTADDFRAALAELTDRIRALEGLDEPDREELVTNLELVRKEADSDEPSKDKLSGRLNRIKSTMEEVSGAIESGREIAGTIASVATWALALFL